MYQNRKLSAEEIEKYSDHIPKACLSQVRAGKYYAGLISDLVGGEDHYEVIYVTDLLAGWIELVALYFFNEEALPIYKANLVRYLIRVEKLRRGGGAAGMYYEIHTDEVSDPDELKHTLMMSGFESRRTVDNIYDLRLSQVKERKFLAKASTILKCISLSEADEQVLEELSDIIREDDRPVPAGYFVNWEDYLQEESLICLKADKPCGVLLLSTEQEHIIVDCAYVADKTALAVMLGNVLPRLETKYGPDQHVLIPVVLDKTGQIVERLAPGAVRGQLIEAIKWFED